MAESTQDLLNSSPVFLLVPATVGDLPEHWSEPGGNPGSGWSQVAGLGLGYDAIAPGADPEVNLARKGTASQSTTGFGLDAANAIDGDPSSYTHTDSDDNDSRLSVDLGQPLRSVASFCGTARIAAQRAFVT